jgi:ADP-ribose pyrophosphatase YjhB (NUDIX family)
MREVREETGLEVRLIDLLSVVIDTYHDRDYKHNMYYLAEVVAGREEPGDDLAELRWFGPTELPQQFAFTHCARVLAAWTRRPRGAAEKWRARPSPPLQP